MKLFYRKIGSGGPTLLLHGLFGSSDNWMSIARSLKDTGQFHVLDLRNHGRSAHSSDFDYTVMVEDIYEFLTDLNLRQVSIIGHSMGGMTAMNFALEYPHRIKKLAVIDMAPKNYPLRHQNIIDGLLAIDLPQIKSRQDADRQLAGYIEQSQIRRFLLKNLYRTSDGQYAWRLNLPVISRSLSLIGSGIKSDRSFSKPCIFIRGGLSDYITDEDEALIKKLFPAAEILTIPATTHWLHAENPQAIISILKTFLTQNKNK